MRDPWYIDERYGRSANLSGVRYCRCWTMAGLKGRHISKRGMPGPQQFQPVLYVMLFSFSSKAKQALRLRNACFALMTSIISVQKALASSWQANILFSTRSNTLPELAAVAVSLAHKDDDADDVGHRGYGKAVCQADRFLHEAITSEPMPIPICIAGSFFTLCDG